MGTRESPTPLRLALGFVGPILFALGLVWLYVERIPDNDGTSAMPYVLLALGGGPMALRLIARLLDRN